MFPLYLILHCLSIYLSMWVMKHIYKEWCYDSNGYCRIMVIIKFCIISFIFPDYTIMRSSLLPFLPSPFKPTHQYRSVKFMNFFLNNCWFILPIAKFIDNSIGVFFQNPKYNLISFNIVCKRFVKDEIIIWLCSAF